MVTDLSTQNHDEGSGSGLAGRRRSLQTLTGVFQTDEEEEALQPL